MTGRYYVEPRPERVFNALTGRLNRAHVVVFRRSPTELNPPPWLLPGTWTKQAAAHIARTCNLAQRKKR